MTQSFCKKTTIFALVATLVLASVFAVLFTPYSTAEALSWGGKDMSEQWYYAEEFLDIAAAKEAVAKWDKSKITKPITVAVVDTGIDANHELFALDKNGVSVLSKNDKGEILGYNSQTGADKDGNVVITDATSKHGSKVAGSIAMLIREFGLENYIKIYPIKANEGNSDNFKLTSLTSAINWAVDNAKADVINMSLGLTAANIAELKRKKELTATQENAFSTAVENARRKSVVVAAAGNNQKSDQNADDLYYPAAYPGVLSVMNVDKNGIYKTSNFGATYTLCAPGVNVYTSKGYQNANAYGTETGTSMAATFASFATALLKLRCQIEGRDMDSVKLAKTVSALLTKTVEKNGVSFKSLDLKSIATGDMDKIDYNYEPPKNIAIRHNGTLGTGEYVGMIYMRADHALPVTFYAQVNPVGKVDPDVENSLEWSITRIKSADDDTPVSSPQTIGSGTSVTYTPTRGGDFIVSAKIPGYATEVQTVQIHVEYGIYYVGEVRVTLLENANDDVSNAPSFATLYTTETTRFALTGVQYLNPDVETQWFVNGKYVASGATFDFTPKKAGAYYITAKYGDNATVDFQYKFTANVKPFIARPLDLAMLILGLAVVVGAIVTVCVLSVRKKKTAKDVAEQNETSEQNETND